MMVSDGVTLSHSVTWVLITLHTLLFKPIEGMKSSDN